MAYMHVRLAVLQPNDAGDPVSGSHISGLSQPCYNVVPVHALIGAPSAGGALGHRLDRLCLETVLSVAY